MRKFLFLLPLVLLIFNNCSDNNCSVDDWTGTYVGKRICNNPLGINQTEDEVTFRISKNTTLPQLPSNTIIIDLKTSYYLIVDECSLTSQAIEPGFLPQYMAEGRLSGDKIKLQIKTPLNSQTCEWEAKKQ